MEEKFEEIEILSNKSWNKALSDVDSFYINSALISVYNKKGTEFINISDSLRKMYKDIYQEKIKLPESIDDNWVSTTLSRYVESDIKLFENSCSPRGEILNKEIIDEVLKYVAKSSVIVNYEGLSVSLNLNSIENVSYEVVLITALRGKLCSSFKLEGTEINFKAITAPAKNLQRHEVLVLKQFITVNMCDKKIDIILSKMGNSFNKIFIDDKTNSFECNFEDYNINWGSFDINRGV